MKHLRGSLIGIAQGEEVVFSDFEKGGEMWAGQGPRERRREIRFENPFREPPTVQVNLSMWDLDADTIMRGDLVAENISSDGFDIVFRTWSDTRVARLRAGWTAIGEVPTEDDWDIC